MAFAKRPISVSRARRYLRTMLWSVAVIVLGAMALPLGWYALSPVPSAQAQEDTDTNPRANYWRAVREGTSGYSAVTGPESNVLIQSGGQNWRQIRNGPVAGIGGWGLLVVLGLLVLAFAARGRVRIEGGRSGDTVARWSVFERTLHWYTAALFIILAITGLSFLFGRIIMIPVLGPEAFAGWAEFAMTVHNYTGPAFCLGVLLMIVLWLENNLPQKGDIAWFRKGGGMLPGKHASAGKANAGEKLFVFWLGLVVVGLTVCATGLILDFPIFGQTRETMQLTSLLHSAGSTIWIFLVLGHAYLGTVGVEGTLEAMTRGHVDRKWAEQHHDLWLEEVGKERR